MLACIVLPSARIVSTCKFLVAVRLGCDILYSEDSSVDKLFFGQQGLKDDFAVLQVVTVQVLSLDFFLAGDFNAVEHAELGHVEHTLEAVVLGGLHRVDAHIDLGDQGQVFDVLELVYLGDVV